MTAASPQLEVSVTWWPADVGPHLWQENAPAHAARDFPAIAAAGLRTVRVPLAWDAFMPSHREVSRRRLRDLEELLRTARSLGLQVIPVLFAQSFGDCILLPRYAVSRGARPGVRVLNDGHIVDGGPRDMYRDPLMLELCVTWIDTMLDAFANHPAIAAWDLGHDPARTMRPRRIADLHDWTALIAGRVRAREDRVMLTLGDADVLSARGVRLDGVAAAVDSLGLLLDPPSWEWGTGSADDATFVMRLALRCAGDEARVVAGLPAMGARASGEALERLAAAGAAGLNARCWSDAGPRLAAAPPCDREPLLATTGLVDSEGRPKDDLEAWSRMARAERPVAAEQPWPGALQVEPWYAHLPGSLLDLHAQWQHDAAVER